MPRKRPQLNEHGLPLKDFKWKPTLPPRPKPVTFAELSDWARRRLQRKLKRGPRMTKKQRGEYLLEMARVMGVIK